MEILAHSSAFKNVETMNDVTKCAIIPLNRFAEERHEKEISYDDEH